MLKRTLLFLGGSLCGLALLIACDEPNKLLPAETGPQGAFVPVAEANGLFRHVCLSDDPEARLVHTFDRVDAKTYRHKGFDLVFKLEGAKCTMRAKPTEPRFVTAQRKISTREAAERLANRLNESRPRINAYVTEDLYVVASTTR